MTTGGAMAGASGSWAALAEHLRALQAGEVRLNAPLREYCTWKIGGSADLLVEPSSGDGLARCLRLLREQACPVVCIGHGTNLLFDDAGIRGAVLRIGGRMSSFTIEGRRIEAQSGAWVPWLARCAARAGLAGLEHIIGIPGTLGGLVVMNGGSKRKSIGDRVARVRAVDLEGRVRDFSREECGFAYRTSVLQGSGLLVTEVILECPQGDPRALRREMLAIMKDRKGKFPAGPNCGSVFVSGGELYRDFGPPGRIIEAAGLKGLRIGDAQVSGKHANFILNLGQATSRDTLELIQRVRERVHGQTGHWLVCEVRHVDAGGTVRPASEFIDHFMPPPAAPGREAGAGQP